MAKQPKQPSNEGAPLYWTGTLYIPGIGHVKGLADPAHVAEFDSQTAHIEGLQRNNYLSTTPPAAPKLQVKIGG